MKKIPLVFLMLLTGILTMNAQETAPTTAAPFLLIAPDARSGGLADMGAATSTDANSQFFNAAKYAFLNSQYSVGLNYTPWLSNLTNDTFLGSVVFASRINERSAWGTSLRYFSYGSIELSNPDGSLIGTESPNEFSIDGSYALKLSENFSMGVVMRYIRSDFAIKSQDSDLKTVNTFAVDLGGYYQSDEMNFGGFNGVLRGGINLSNIGPKVKLTDSGEKNNIPTNLRIGGGMDFIMDDVNTLTANIELNQLLISDVSFGDMAYAFSAEYNYNHALALRGGYYHETQNAGDRQYYTLGGGLRFKSATLDFSYLINASDVNSPLENTLRFSLSFDFGELYNVVTKTNKEVNQ